MEIRAKKSLGQHFLRSKAAIEKIVMAGQLSWGETVLEIGPGNGVLTEALLLAGARVIAVETDIDCITFLEQRFEHEIEEKRFLLIAGDIRKHELQKKLFDKKFLGSGRYKLIANIPYYITGMLFRLFLETLRQPELIVFLVQKEVAQEIVARDGKEGILSLSVKAYGSPRMVGIVKREAFSPPPKIDSAIIAVENISRKRFSGDEERRFFETVKAGLGSRRKMLIGNLAQKLNITRTILLERFIALQIDPGTRGEDLSTEKWFTLSRALLKDEMEG